MQKKPTNRCNKKRRSFYFRNTLTFALFPSSLWKKRKNLESSGKFCQEIMEYFFLISVSPILPTLISKLTSSVNQMLFLLLFEINIVLFRLITPHLSRKKTSSTKVGWWSTTFVVSCGFLFIFLAQKIRQALKSNS